MVSGGGALKKDVKGIVMAEQAVQTPSIEKVVNDVLQTIDRDREREIVARRFGLFDRKETLEQIGELLGITRERVRQLEKAVVARLKAAAGQGQLPHVGEVQSQFIDTLEAMGCVARVQDLSAKLTDENSRLDQARVAFLAQLCPDLAVVEDNDNFHYSVGLRQLHNDKQMKDQVAKIIDAVRDHGEPTSIDNVAEILGDENPNTHLPGDRRPGQGSALHTASEGPPAVSVCRIATIKRSPEWSRGEDHLRRAHCCPRDGTAQLPMAGLASERRVHPVRQRGFSAVSDPTTPPTPHSRLSA